MKFRTEIPPITNQFKLDYQKQIVAIGSCFANHIGTRLKDHRFNIEVNPLGILFNPMSIAQVLNAAPLKKAHLIDTGSGVVSLDYHSKFRGDDMSGFNTLFQDKQEQVKVSLDQSDLLILTFGTAWAYEYKPTGAIIANCQKQNADLFEKKILDLNELKSVYIDCFKRLFDQNPNLNIVLTVSPVRHIKDGLVENSLSKSVLIALSHQLANVFKDQVIYYPSYEILMDDLRDYRFYESDLIHPNQMAIDYVYEHFQASFCTKETQKTVNEVDRFNKLLNHQFMFANDAQKQKHFEKVAEWSKKIEKLIGTKPVFK